MENPTPPSSMNDELKIKPMLKEYTPVTAIIKGGFVDESISSMSAEIFTNFMNSILKHNQSSLIERVVDKRPPPPLPIANKGSSTHKMKTNLAPMTLQSEPIINTPIEQMEGGSSAHPRSVTSKNQLTIRHKSSRKKRK